MKRYMLAGASALALAVTSTPALAQDYEQTSTSIAPGDACGTAVITWDNPTEWEFFGDYRVGDEQGTADDVTGQNISEGPLEGEPFGKTYNLTDLPAGQTVTETVTVPEGTEDVQVSAWVKRGPEQRSYSQAAPVSITPCPPETPDPTTPPEPAEPTEPSEEPTETKPAGDKPDKDDKHKHGKDHKSVDQVEAKKEAPTPTPQEDHIAVTG